jgi:hypothetical protein
MGVLNRMIKQKDSNTNGKSAATCKNEKKTGEGPIHILKCALYIIYITWFYLVFVVCRISVLTGMYFLTTGA